MKIFGTINRVEKQEDGTLLVSGVASSGSRDSHKTIITPDAMRNAIPDYMQFANVREMHDSTKAAGVTERMEVNGDDMTEVTVRVVDPTAILKCETGVYKGFSIGGRVTKRNEDDKSIIEGIRLSELSLVDRPSNPLAVFDVFRAEGETVEDDGIVIAPVEAGGEEEVARGGEEEEIQPAAVLLVEAMERKFTDADGKEILMRSADGGSTWVVADEEEIARGSYNISELARLAESLEYFANSRSYDVGDGTSAIPEQARKLAGQLYDMLIVLVGEDVAAAKQRLKDAKRVDEDNDLQRAAAVVSTLEGMDLAGVLMLNVFRRSLAGDNVALHAFNAGDIGIFASDAESIERLKSFIDDAGALAAKIEALPAPSPLERAAAKEKDNAVVGEEEEVQSTDPLSTMKRVHAQGGKRGF